MNKMNIGHFLRDHRLHINSRLEKEVAVFFCSTNDEDGRKRMLRTWFEGYIYVVTLGIVANRRKEFGSGEKIQKASRWSYDYLNQYQYIISVLMTRKDILAEIGLVSPTNDNKEQNTLNTILDSYPGVLDKEDIQAEFFKEVLLKMKDICDEYMNGGLELLAEKKKDGTVFADRLETLVDFLEAYQEDLE